MRVLLLMGLIALGASPACADGAALSPGKPAGIKDAQLVRDPAFYIVFGLGLAGTAIAIAASSSKNSTITTSATSTR